MPRSTEHREHRTPRERVRAGKAAREATPVEQNGQFQSAADRADPVAILRQQAKTPASRSWCRSGTAGCSSSPFAFFRGAAAVMAADLAGTPDSGLTVQLCGDAHLLELRPVRLARAAAWSSTSTTSTRPTPAPGSGTSSGWPPAWRSPARDNGFARTGSGARSVLARRPRLPAGDGRVRRDERTRRLVRPRGRRRTAGHARRPVRRSARRKTFDKALAKARGRTSMRGLRQAHRPGRRASAGSSRTRRCRAGRATCCRTSSAPTSRTWFRGCSPATARTLQSDRRDLLDRFEFVDMARKVVGVGSVGTRCWIVLMRGRDDGDPLFLQVKEAQRSVIAEVRRPASARTGQGGRARGRRPAADAGGQRHLPRLAERRGRSTASRDFYVRQLADWKGSVVIEGMSAHGAGRVRPAVRLDPGPRARPHRRPRRHRRLPRRGRGVRRGDRRLRAPCTPTRTSATTRPWRTLGAQAGYRSSPDC